METQRERDHAILKELWAEEDSYGLCLAYFGRRLTPGQIEIVDSIAFDRKPRVTIRTPTRYGKSRCIEMGLLLWTMNNENKKLIFIAPTREKTSIIRDYMAEDIVATPALMELLHLDRTGRDRIKKEVSRSRMTWKNGIDMRILTADKGGKGQALMGWGGHKIVVEEAGEMNAELWPKIERMLADFADSTYVEIGNPWTRDNFFWQHELESHGENPAWHSIHIDYRQAIREGRLTQEFIDRVRANPHTPPVVFQVLYEAEFPDSADDQLIPYWAIKKAIRPVPQLGPADEKMMGLDIAEMGRDLTVFTMGGKWKELYIAQEIKWYAKKEVMETVGWAVKLCDDNNGFHRITPDATGMGTGVAGRLKELIREERITGRVSPFIAAQKPRRKRDQKLYKNIKAQAGFHLRELFIKGKIIIPNHPILIDQLNKMKYKLNSSGQIMLLDPGEAPDDTSEKKSPDFFDSLSLFAWDKGFKAVIR